MISALFFPVSGLFQGIVAIKSLAFFAQTPLQTVARAGALCMVVQEAVSEETEDLPDDDRPESDRRKDSPPEDVRREDNRREDDQQDAGIVDVEAGEIEIRQVKTSDIRAERNRTSTSNSHGSGSIFPKKFLSGRSWMTANIHGRFVLPPGYILITVPWGAKFEDDQFEKPLSWWERTTKGLRRYEKRPTDIACSYNMIKSLVSVFQVIFGVITLYRTRGNEIDRYGYAAFGLTVTPYAWMSLINLLGNLMRPEYPALYVVGSPLLDDICKKYGSQCADGTVGRLTEESAKQAQDEFRAAQGYRIREKTRDSRKDTTKTKERTKKKKISEDEKRKKKVARENVEKDEILRVFSSDSEAKFNTNLAVVVGISVPLIILGVLSRFQKGNSTEAQRVWTMCWFAFGNLFNISSLIRSSQLETLSVLDPISLLELVMFLGVIPYTVPAFGGFVVVAQIINEHRICSKMLV